MESKDIRFLGIVFFLCAMSFTQTTTTLVVGAITLVTYLAIYKRNKKVILLCVSCLLSFALVEGIGRLIDFGNVELAYDLENDHRMKPYWQPGINGDGIRCWEEAEDFTESTFNIICLGDSFTFGAKTTPQNPDVAFPAQLDGLLNNLDLPVPAKVANFGWVSSSPLLSARLLKDIGHKYKPDLVMLFVDITDFRDDCQYRYASNPIGNSPTLILLHQLGLLDNYLQLRERWRVNSFARSVLGLDVKIPHDRFFIINQPLEESLPHLVEIEKNIGGINTYCKEQLHIPFIMVLLPRNIHYNSAECPNNWERVYYTAMGPHVFAPFEWFAQYETQVDFPCYSLLDTFQRTTVFPTCFENDPHWLPEGNRVAAEGVLDILQKEGYVPRTDNGGIPHSVSTPQPQESP